MQPLYVQSWHKSPTTAPAYSGLIILFRFADGLLAIMHTPLCMCIAFQYGMDQVQLGHNKGSPPAIHNGDLLKVLTSYYLLNMLSCELWIDPIHAPKVHVALTSTSGFIYQLLYTCLTTFFQLHLIVCVSYKIFQILPCEIQFYGLLPKKNGVSIYQMPCY